MKKEASGKKGKWLWLVLGIVALLAVVGVVLALVLGGQGDDKTAGGRAELYWNVDKVANTDRDTGLSIREPAEDGNYYVRFAHDGEQVEIPVADKKLVNYIDSLELMNLVLDSNGYVVDVKPLTEVASVIGESLYVQSVTGNTVIANSSIMMNGRKITVELNDEAGIYNVSGKGEFVGEAIDPSELNPMDTISVYGTLLAEDSEEETVVTHVFVLKQPAESAVYWRTEQFYNSTDKVSTRVPDENGVYTIEFFVDGETVELKTKDLTVATTIDAPSYYWCHFGLEFDEEGYIVEVLDSFLAARTLLQCERYDITEIYEDGSYVATSLIKNNGAFVQGTVGADCPIYDVSKVAKAEGEANRRVDSLQMGDRVCIWTDTNGTPVLIYVAHRLTDSPAYWNVTRSYDSTALTTSRVPNESGYYEIEMLEAGKTETTTFRTKDIEIATAIDKPTDRCVGLKLAEDGKTIECVYDMECVFGYTYFCRGYFVQDVTGSVATYLSPAYSGVSKNGVLAADAKVWNVSTHGVYGEETTLQYGDTVYACKTPTGEVANAYVYRRVLGIDTAYWNITRMYDTTNKVTTRVPDENGYYVFEMAHKGEIVTVKTKDIELANKIDSQSSHRYFSLIVKNGIVTEVNDAYYCLGGSRYASHYVIAVDGNKITTLNSSKTTEYEIILGDDCQIFNVSTAFKDHKGEKTTLQVGDYITLYRDVDATGTVLLGWVRSREVSKMAWPVDPQYDSTNACTAREADEDGWYYIDLAIDGQVKTYKTKVKDIASGIDSYTSAFGVDIKGDVIVSYSASTYVTNVDATAAVNYTVSGVSGKTISAVYTLGSADKTGTKETVKMASGCKVYDVSGTAEKFGAEVTLKEGDTIRAYVNEDGEALFVYVVSHCTRAGGYKSLCDHCGEVVFWNAYTSSANVVAFDCHYYLPADLQVTAQLRVYSTARDFETVLDLNGHTLVREGGRAALVRYGDTLTIFDSSADKTGVIKTRNNTSNGGVIMISSDKTNGTGIVNIGCPKVVTENGKKVVTDEYLWGGTLTIDAPMTIVEDEKTGNVALVVDETITGYSVGGGLVTNSGIFNLYNGDLVNGFVQSKEDGATGAGVKTSGTFNMYGGKIANCLAIGWHINEEGETKYYTGSGGNIYSEGTTNIYGGTIEGGTASRGGNISIAGGTFTIHGGTVKDGVASTAYGKTADARGGNILNSGKLYINGGTITDGTVVGKNYGGNIYGSGLKGCIYISGDAVVSGGTYATVNTETLEVTASLSNIYLMYSNVEVSGGVVDGGEWTSGNVITSTGTNTGGGCTITVSGGTVNGNITPGGSQMDAAAVDFAVITDAAGTTTEMKYADYLADAKLSGNKDLNVIFYQINVDTGKNTKVYPDYRTALILSGGTVNGTVNGSNAKEINVSGNPVVSLLQIGENKINVDTMTSGASVTLDTVGVFSAPMSSKAAAEAVAAGKYFNSTNAELIVGVTDKNALKIYHPNAITGYCEHCAGDADWIPTDVLPTAGGHYVLTGNVTVTEEAEIGKGAETVLDLAGYTVTGGEGIRAFNIKGGKLSIIDSSVEQTGTITGGSATRGGNIYVSSGSFSLYSGTISNGVANNELGTTNTNGRGGNIFGFGSVYLYGGAVTGGSAMNGSGYGGNICITGLTSELYISDDAVISNGDAKTGGNVYMMYSNLNMTGGTITGGTANTGANIYTGGTSTGGASTVTITDGTITDGAVFLSGAVAKPTVDPTTNEEVTVPYPDYRTAVTISGGTFDCKFEAANVKEMKVSGKPVFTQLNLGDEVLLTLGEMIDGASVALTNLGVFTTPMESKEVAESYVKYFVPKGATYIIKATDEFALTHTVDMGDVTTQTFFCEDCQKDEVFNSWNGIPFEMDGHYYLTEDVTLSEAVTIASGLDITLELNGHVLTAAADSRVFYVNGELNIQDSSEAQSGTVTGGRATRGGNIYVNGGTFKLHSGNIVGGVADNDLATATTNGRGGNIFINGGHVYLLGGTVVGGQTNGGSGYGGNICATGMTAYVHVSNDAVVADGSAKTGGNFYLMYSNLEVTGGTIRGGVASSSAGNIYTNGTSSGGYSTVTISGGTISDGSVYLGGSTASETDKYPDYRTVATISGGTLDCSITVNASAFDLSGATVIKSLSLGNATLINVGALSGDASIGVKSEGVFTNAVDAAAVKDFFHAAEAGYAVSVVESEGKEYLALVSDSGVVGDCPHCEGAVWTAWDGTAISESGHYYLTGNVTLTSQISIGSSKDVVVDLNGNTITADGCRAFSISGNATLSIIDSVGTGVITGGNSNGARGGNIYASSGNLHLYGGSIYGGTAATTINASGHDIAVYNGEFTTSGNVQIGQAYQDGYAVYLFNNTALDLADATITGGVVIRGVSNVKLSSSLSVDTLAFFSAKLAEVEMRDGMDKIAVKLVNGDNVVQVGAFTGTLTNAEIAVNYFESAATGYTVTATDHKLEIVKDTTGGDSGGDSTEPTDPSNPTVPSEPSTSNCPHCDGAEWTAWDGQTVTSGHYYLTGNVAITEAQLEIAAGEDVVIDLRGNTITATKVRAFYVKGTLSICDTVGNGEVVGTGVEDEATDGGVFYLYGKSTLNLYSGTLRMADENYGAQRGGVIYLSSGTLNISGGTVKNGVADGNPNATSALNKAGRGGNICMLAGGTINISGNAVIDGGQAGYAGNIYCGGSANAKVIISGEAVISNGTATTKNAGNIYVEQGTLEISGGTMSGGTAPNGSGANILMSHETMADLVITGGTLYGETKLGTLTKFAISGNPVIEKLLLNNDTVITELGTLSADASIGVSKVASATNMVFTSELLNAAEVLAQNNFHAAETGYTVAVTEDGKYLEIVEDTTATDPTEPSEPADPTLEACPHCAGAEWTAWDDSAVVDGALASGHYYVPEGGIALTDRIEIAAGEDVVIDLRGQTITAASAARAFYVYGNLSIVDTSADETGKIVGSAVTSNGGTIYVNTNAVLNLYSGTVTGGSAPRGGNLYIGTNATFNMTGGAVVGGVADQALTDGTSTTNGRGGNIFSNNGIINISGGTIADGVTNNSDNKTFGGNAIFVGKSGGAGNVVNISGDVVISGGVADNGSNIALCYVEMAMTGGSITDGIVYMYGSTTYSSLNISAGTVDNLYAYQIEELVVSGTAVIKGLTLGTDEVVTVGTLAEGAEIILNEESGVFTAPFADAATAEANLTYFDAAAYNKTVVVTENALEVVEGCPCGCKAPASKIVWTNANTYFAQMAESSNVKVDESVHLKLSADLNMVEVYGAGKQIEIGKTVASNVTVDLNGFTWSTVNTRAMYIYANSTVTFVDTSAEQTGKIVSTGKSGNNGGVLAVYGNLNLRSGTIALTEEPVALVNGGVLYMNSTGGVFNMYGGTITGGKTASTDLKSSYGANIYIYNGEFNMYGGTISNGTATGNATYPSYGGNLTVRETVTVNLYGGTISGGSADFGGDIYMMVSATAGGTLNIGNAAVAGEVYVPSALATVAVSGDAQIGELVLADDAVVTVGELTEGASIAVNKATEFTGALEDPDSVKGYFTGMNENSGIKVTAENKLIIVAGCVCGCGTPSDEVVWQDAVAYITALKDAETGVISKSVHLTLNSDVDITEIYGKAQQISLRLDGSSIKVTIDLNGRTWSSTHRLYVYESAELTIMDSSEAGTGKMTGTGASNGSSGRVIINYGTINLLSGTLTMTEEGANSVATGGVYYQSKGVFNMYGGAIINGRADGDSGKGGNVNIRLGEFNVYGGTITGGTAATGANIYVGASGTLNLYADDVVVGAEGDDTNGIYKA